MFGGAQGHLSPYLDVMPALEKVDDGKYAAAAASLAAMRAMEVKDLDKRLVKMSATLSQALNGMLASMK